MKTITLILLGLTIAAFTGCTTFCKYVPIPQICNATPVPTPVPPIKVVSGATEGWRG